MSKNLIYFKKYEIIYEYFLKNKIFFIIFFSFFLTRCFFNFFLGNDHFELQIDSYWYSGQSDEIIKGNLNLERQFFITAPFFPYFQALIKIIGGNFWQEFLYFLQLLISSIAGFYFYKLSLLIFKDRKGSILSTLIFCFYPFTLWWTGTFTQDIWFQSFLIIFLFYFIDFLQTKKTSILIKSAVLFAFTYLTKSHILLFSPFIPLIIIFYHKGNYINKLKHIIIFTTISLLFTLPYGLYNLKVNNVYALSSAGWGATFLLGHNDDAYLNHINTPDRNSEEAQRLRFFEYHVLDELEESLERADFNTKNEIYVSAGLKWIKENPKKNLDLLFFNIKRFFMPGLSKSWYSFNKWVFSLIITVPIYILAYMGIVYNIVKKPREHYWIIFLMLSLFVFSVGFYFQGRFRVITLEHFYILYAGFMLQTLLKKKKKK